VGLNILQRLCGIATLTNVFVEKVKRTGVRIVDTRKTTPGLRFMEKYAVRIGGGSNHRFGLFDGILIKDNHIEAAGNIASAVSAARQARRLRAARAVLSAAMGDVNAMIERRANEATNGDEAVREQA